MQLLIVHRKNTYLFSWGGEAIAREPPGRAPRRVVVVVVIDVVVERLACVWTVLWTRAKNARPTQELPEISVGQTTMSADVSVLREIGDICRVVRHVAEMSPTLPT